MKYYIVSLLLAFVPFTGYSQKTALELNDEIANITDSLFSYGQKWGNAFSEAAPSKDFSTLAKHRKATELFIDNSIQRIKNMHDIGDSQDLRLAMVDFLMFEKDMVRNGFTPAEKLSANTTDADIDAFISNLTNLSAKESIYLEKVRKEQEKYAEQNGFSIESGNDEN